MLTLTVGLSHSLTGKTFPCPQPHIQGRLVPQEEHLLPRPILGVVAQFQVEVPKHSCHDRPHFRVCEVLALSQLASCYVPQYLS